MNNLLTFISKDVPETTNRNWEDMLYSNLYDYHALTSLPSYTRVTVEGVVHMVK